jgi:hypothetical protein
MGYESWQITVTATAGFHREPGTGRVKYLLWFSAVDTDTLDFIQPRAKVMLVSNVGNTEGLWHEYRAEVPIEQARPILETLRSLGLPNGKLQGGGVSDGSETWDHLSVLIALDDNNRLQQCVVGGYDWDSRLSPSLLRCLQQVVALLGEPYMQTRDVKMISDSLTRRAS